VPATAQLADPLSLAASGVLLPFFSDPAAGFVSVLEVVSPIVPNTIGFDPAFEFTNPLHFVFFRENCGRNKSASLVQTHKQAHALISNSPALGLDHNGLAAIGSSLEGNDLLPLNFPIHTRTHWIDTKTGRLRELEPITVDTFLQLNPGFLPLVENPGAGGSIGLGFPFVWNPLRSAAQFVTPQESASIKASVYLICPTADIQNSSGTGGVFPATRGFPRIQNRDGSFGFPGRNVITGSNVTSVRGRIFDDNEELVRDFQLGCTCLSTTPILNIDTIYSLPPTNLGLHTVPVWYTELETQTVNPNPVVSGSAQQFSFTGYWGLEVAGHEGTLFHRLSNASLDNLSNGTANPFGNR
jgi:hypothetical protein